MDIGRLWPIAAGHLPLIPGVEMSVRGESSLSEVGCAEIRYERPLYLGDSNRSVQAATLGALPFARYVNTFSDYVAYSLFSLPRITKESQTRRKVLTESHGSLLPLREVIVDSTLVRKTAGLPI